MKFRWKSPYGYAGRPKCVRSLLTGRELLLGPLNIIYIYIFKFVDVYNKIYVHICVPVWNKKLYYVRRCVKSFYIDHRPRPESDSYNALSVFKTISVGPKDIDVPFELINLLISTYVLGCVTEYAFWTHAAGIVTCREKRSSSSYL